MGNHLMTIKIKVDPIWGAATFATAQNSNVKLTSLFDITHRKSQMKRGH
jgi:hypothetical protein